MNVLHWEQLSKKKNEEIAQLKARVQELEVVLKEMQRNGQKQNWNDHYESTMEKVEKVLSQTPAQSLAETQAQALVWAAKELQPKHEFDKGMPQTAVWTLNDLATKLRQQAKGE